MTLRLSGAPFPVTYRQLWSPSAINANALLSNSVQGGQPLTLTGARGATSTEGVSGIVSVNSVINCGALYDNIGTLWVNLWFRLLRDPAAGGAVLWGKNAAGTLGFCSIQNATGNLFFRNDVGGVLALTINNPGWILGAWYNVHCSYSAANGKRLLLNNGSLQVNASVSATPNGGNLFLFDYDAGGGNGNMCDIADVSIGTADLTAAEETALYRGIIPANAVNFWPLDEGRGVTAYDRGSGGNNATLGSAITWKYGQVRQPLLSLDGINDRGQSSAGVRIDGPHTWVLVVKSKSTYNALAASHYLTDMDGAAAKTVFYYDSAADAIKFRAYGTGAIEISYATKPAINDYLILIGTVDSSDIPRFYVNATLVGAGASCGVRTNAGRTLYLGSSNVPSLWDGSKPLFLAQIDGALSAAQVTTYSRYLRDMLNLPISI